MCVIRVRWGRLMTRWNDSLAELQPKPRPSSLCQVRKASTVPCNECRGLAERFKRTRGHTWMDESVQKMVVERGCWCSGAKPSSIVSTFNLISSRCSRREVTQNALTPLEKALDLRSAPEPDTPLNAHFEINEFEVRSTYEPY
jgi:hypothetical protein